MEYNRKCPNCGRKIPYKNEKFYLIAIEKNTVCRKCVNLVRNVDKEKMYKKIGDSLRGRKIPDERKKRISQSVRKLYDNGEIDLGDRTGKNNNMYGKSVHDIWLEKYGKEEADTMWNDRYKYMRGENNPVYKRIITNEHRKNMRLSAIKRIERSKFRDGQLIPAYNSDACKIIDEYNKKYGFNFQHAENGGEVCIDGYFPDGLDEKKKTIIEIDEPKHFNSDGKYKQKDIQRQEYLENLGYKFIRVKI